MNPADLIQDARSLLTTVKASGANPTAQRALEDMCERLLDTLAAKDTALAEMRVELEAIRTERDAPASIADAKPAGWFNPWSDYHGYQQVHADYEESDGTIALYPWSELSRFVEERDNAVAARETAEASLADLAAENERLRKALELARLWLANSLPVADIAGPKPMPVIDAALSAARALGPLLDEGVKL